MATSAGSIPITATFNAAQLEKDVLSALTRIQSKSTLNLNTRNFTQPLGKITGLANEFNKSLEASNARVVAFGASAGVIFAVQKSFSALVTSTIEVEKSLIDINIVLNTSAKGIKQFGDQLFEVARSTGSSFKDVAAAATEFSRQGLGLEETLRRTRDALILTRLSGLDVVSSTEALTAAVNSFTKEALTTTDVVNKLAAVDAKFAVSSRDLSEALQRVGSSASEAGVSFDELLGIVTSVQQTTARGGAVIGNALKTIFTRIERPQVINDLKDFGITVTDISGNVLPTIKVIENLAQSFQSLNPVVKSQVAELVGGVYQINILKAALSDVSKQNSAFAEATRASSQAADEAILKNDALNKSLSALINETSANFSQFASAIGNASVAPGIRKVLEAVNKSLSAYNEKDSEGVGAKIATGLLTGITDFITGPGLLLGGLAVGKLLSNFTKFAGDAAKNILGLNSVGRQQAVLQGEISKILSSNPELIQQILSGTKTRLQVEKEIRQTLYEQAALAKTIVNITESQAKRMIVSGVEIDQEGQFKSKGKVSAGGFIPAQQQAAEKVGAMQGGYAPGKVVAAPKSIGGVMNTAEKVKYIPGFAQPYILPPEGSRAAQSLASKSMAKNGINPYMARGFVPNFGGPPPLDNAGRYGDDDYWYSSKSGKTFLSEVRLKDKDGNPDKAAWGGPDKGFYRTDGLPFTATDLNKFVRAGVTYGEIRRYLPDSFVQDDPRAKAGVSLDQLKKEYKPGAKIATVESVKEEAKRVFEPFTPPASMLIWDLAGKNSDQDEIADLEKFTKDKKQAGRSFRIKIRALSGSPLNEEKFGLIDKTSKFARDITKKLATGIPGAKSDYSDKEVDSYFNKTGKNYNVLAGTIFEAGTNLAASYVRDQEFNKTASKLSAIGGDFDVKGGANLANVQKFFPGFTDSYGDYKLNNSYDAIREFIDKVRKEFPLEIGNHFDKQESKIAGIKTSAKGFIPNFAPKPFNFRFSSLGEKTAQISPKLRDWLADKYFDPEMASAGTLERLSSLNRDSGAFFSSLENPNAVAGIPVRGQQGFISRQNRGARAGAFLNALRTRLPDFVPGSLPNLASGFIPNFAPNSPSFINVKALSKNPVTYSGDLLDFMRQIEASAGRNLSEGEKRALKYPRANLSKLNDQNVLDKFLNSESISGFAQFAKGFVPNFLKPKKPKIKSFKTGEGERVLGPTAIVNKQTREKFIEKVLAGHQDQSYIKYSKKDGSIDVDFVRSSRRGDGGMLWDRAGNIAKQFDIPLTTSAFIPQKENLEKYDAETNSFGDVLSTGFPQLKWSERGKAKNTKLNVYNDHLQYPVDSKRTFSEAQSLLNNIYKYDAVALKDSILSENTYIQDIISYFAKGHVPNFNAVQEAIGREMSAGYSSSQVKVGQSSKLKTNFNPMGLGVYNSTEGSLNGGIGLAEKAGINPKTKGMSARGHIPNFAEFGGVDAVLSGGALLLFYSSIKDITGELKNYKDSIKAVQKEQTDAASSYAQELQQIPKDFTKKQTAIQDEIAKTFTNVGSDLKLTGTSTAPLVSGPFTMDPLTRKLSRSSPVEASPEQVKRLEELRAQLAEEKKGMQEKLKAADSADKEARNNAARVQGPVFGKGMFQEGSKFSTLSKTMGPSIGILGAGLANVISEFIPKQNKTTKALASGVGDVLSSAGAGAAFGPAGLAVGAVYGVYQAFRKLEESKAAEVIEKINDNLELTKQKASDFSGAAQNYATSLEGLQSALNDPKTKPEALLKFQNNLTDALSSIPDEFRNKVLQAGTDITKVSEAIAGVNKELGNTQKNLERQLAISAIIKDESSIFGNASVSKKNQNTLNSLFSSSVNPESVAKNFQGGSAATDLNTFFENLKRETTYTRDVYSMSGGMTSAVKIGEEQALDRGSVESIKSKLKDKGILSESIADILDNAFGKLDLTAVTSIINAIQKQGLAVVDSARKAKILTEILEVNTKRIIANAEALKALNEQFNDINLQISNQIDIEKNRGKTIREINKIQAEGVVSTQRARVKGALDAFAPFVGEGTKNNIQNQLDTNEINVRQNSQIRDATSKLLDSLSDSITKKVEEARGKIVPAIEGATGTDNIQKQRAVFQRQIDLLTPVVTQGLKGINETGNVSDTRGSLIKIIQDNAGINKAFTKEASELLIQSLDVSFNEFQNELAKIKAQGDVDLDIQKASREYQKQSLALNQRLSFAGGAQALSSTGKTGVSDLFDSLSELVSEFRQTNAIGSAAQKGSTSFKFLDILTNQLQLNRATEAPTGYKDAQSFNKEVSSDLNPLAATAIAGRVKQIRDSLNLAKDLTEIQTGKSTEGTALGTAFDMAKEGAVKTALDQIASQFKLENMGNYLDLLQQEARYLNDLTRKQNQLLESALPTSINNNFKDVIETRVGVRLDTLTSSLTGAINKLATSTKRGTVETDIANKLPSDIPPQKREDLLKRIQASGELKPTPLTTPTTEGQEAINELKKKNKEELNKYSEALAAVVKDKEQMGAGRTSLAGEDATKFINKIRAKYNIDGTSGELSVKQVASRQLNVDELPQQTPNYENLSGTYKEFVDKANQDFGTSITEETVKSIKSLLAERRKLDVQDLLSSPPPLPPLNTDLSGKSNKGALMPNIPDELARTRANVDQTNARGAIRTRNAEELAALNKEVEGLLAQKNKTAEQEARLLKKQIELREKGLQVENDNAQYNFDLYYKKGGLGDKSFKDERAVFANARIESNARQGNVDIGAITEKNTTYNKADFARDTGQLIDTFQTDFKSGIGSAFGEAIKGTKTLKDAFRDMFQGILNRMLDKSLEMGVDALFAFGKAATGLKNGGEIKKYNSGGMVTGGSGMKDDVPAMMSGGEYVIKKSSVDKYGTDYLRNLNGGAVPRYATGGFSIGPLQNEFLYDNPDRPTSGEYAVDSRLSAAALTDDSNPQNKLREDRYEKLDQYLQDRAQYERDKKQSLKNYKNQVNSTFYSGLTAAAVQIGAAGLTMGAEKLRTPKATVGKPYQAYSSSMPNYTGKASGGYIAKFAGGGSTGQDNIPALLMGGEYVMNKKAVDMYGKDFMGRLNSGSLPKYASGGMVGTSYSGQSNTDQSSSMDELVTALNTLNDNLSKDSGITQSESGRASLAGATQESGMSIVNNISINVAQSGEVSSEANSNTQKGSSNSKNNQNSIENNGKLAELLRGKVVEVLIEQKRPGGLLYSSR